MCTFTAWDMKMDTKSTDIWQSLTHSLEKADLQTDIYKYDLYSHNKRMALSIYQPAGKNITCFVAIKEWVEIIIIVLLLDA